MNLNALCGEWENFENYFDDPSKEMRETWQCAEKAVRNKKDLVSKVLFWHGAKAFWKKYCNTLTQENHVQIGYWKVENAEDGIVIRWLDQERKEIGAYSYRLSETIENGLEKKENYLLESKETSPFRYVLLMEPMKSEKVISHLHFQFASKRGDLLTRRSRLKRRHWYATMCEGNVSEEERCKIVKALHQLTD